MSTKPEERAGRNEPSKPTGEPRQPYSKELQSFLTDLLASWRAEAGATGRTLVSALEGLSANIRDLRAGFATFGLVELQDEFIPTATDQLEAVVEMTERATNRIMDAADLVEAAIDGVDEAAREKLREATTTIYEACNFQDITGQRVRKVVAVLREIESKINALLAILDNGSTSLALPLNRPSRTDEPTAPMGRGELLEGPQLHGRGSSQDEIDALFADDWGCEAGTEDPAPAATPIPDQPSSGRALG